MHLICNSSEGLVPLPSSPTTPDWQRHQAVPPVRFRLFPFRSPLLRESLLLSIPRGTEMFQFPRFPPLALCVQARVTPHDGCRVSPFGHPRIDAWSAAPRGFSQPPTSFIGIRRQGIHRWLFVAWRTKMLVLAMQVSRGGRRRGNGHAQRLEEGLLPQNGTEKARRSHSPTWEDESCDRLDCGKRRIARGQLGVLVTRH